LDLYLAVQECQNIESQVDVNKSCLCCVDSDCKEIARREKKDMEGYLEIRTKKLLQSNKKFWFVLREEQLDYYNDKEDVTTIPIGQVALSDIVDVRVVHDQKNTLTLVRRGQENLRLKVKGGQGQAHNWMGSIRERIFSAREGEVPVLRKKKRRAVRNIPRPYEGVNLMSLSQQRYNRSADDQSQSNLSEAAAVTEQESHSDSDGYSDRFAKDNLSLTSSFRSRNTSVSSSSLFSGSSVSSLGSNGLIRRKARIPVSGFTGRAYLANEKKMVEEVEIITNEDFEYIVQAERDASSINEVANGFVEETLLNDEEKENKEETISRNVRFNSTEDIHLLEEETRNDKKNKKNKKSKVDKDLKVKTKETDSTRHRTSSFGWGRNILGKAKVRETCEMKEQTITSEDLESTVNTNKSAFENKNVNVDNSNMDNNISCDSKSETNLESDTKYEEKEIMETKSSKYDLHNKSDDTESQIQLRCVLSEHKRSPNQPKANNLDFLPRLKTESQTFQDELINSTPKDFKRNRVTSVSSIQSRDSLDSVTSSGMKDRIFHWKRSSSKSIKSVTISNPLETQDQYNITISNDINSQIDKIANDKLEAVYKQHRTSAQEASRDQSKIPQKPLKFHIKQLEQLLAGVITPPKSRDMSEVQLRLDSLLVMMSLSSIGDSSSTTVPQGYDVPRPL